MSLGALPAMGFAQEHPLKLGDDLPYGVWEDKTAQASFEQVQQLPAAALTTVDHLLAKGYSRSVYWLKVPLPTEMRDGGEWLLEIIPPYLDHIDVYEPRGEAWVRHRGGDMLPVSARESTYRNPLFYLQPRMGTHIWIRVQTTSTQILMGHFWRESSFRTHQEKSLFYWGTYFGLVAFTLLFVAAMFWVFKQTAFLSIWFGCLTSAGLVLNALGIPGTLFFPENPVLASHLVSWTALLAYACGFWVLQALVIQEADFKLGERLTKLCIFLCLALLPSVPLDFYGEWVALPQVLLLLMILWSIGILTWQLSQTPQVTSQRADKRLLLVALTFHLCLSLPSVFMMQGLVKPREWMPTFFMWDLLPFTLILSWVQVLRIRQTYRTWQDNKEQALAQAQLQKLNLELGIQARTQELSEARAELEHLLATERRLSLEQRQFFGMISHEFRTPLAVVDAAATNLMAVPPGNQEELKQRAQQILRATKRLSQLIENTLMDNRFEFGGFVLHPETVALGDWVREASQLVEWSSKHHLRSDLSQAPAYWAMDPTLMRIALSNLLDNAIKYSPQGEIEVRVTQQDAHLHIQVKDQGPGVAPQDLERIFQRFVRGHEVKGTRGIGLGLHVARQIAQLHGGDLAVTLPEEGGALFTLSIQGHPYN